MIPRPLRVFLCHSSNDKPAVRELYQKLRNEPWIQPWLDEEELYPGQDWNMEIENAIEETDVIIICLSKGSTTKEGYVQKEIRAALDYADYKPEGSIFIIPIRLEECNVPSRLSKFQWLDIANPKWYEFLLETLKVKLREKLPYSISLLIQNLINKYPYDEFIVSLRILEALYGEGMLPLSSLEQEEIINAVNWLDKKLTENTYRMSVMKMANLHECYKDYQDLLNNKNDIQILIEDERSSYTELVAIQKKRYEICSQSYTNDILWEAQRFLQFSPVYTLGFLQKKLDDLPFADDDRKRLINMIGEVKSLNVELEQSAVNFINNILSDEERKVVDYAIRDKTVDDISQILFISQQIVSVLLDSSYEKLKRTYKLEKVNQTIMANYLRPYWKKYH